MSIPRGIQELGCQGQDVGDDVHALVTTIQGHQIFVTEWENSGRGAVCRGSGVLRSHAGLHKGPSGT